MRLVRSDTAIATTMALNANEMYVCVRNVVRPGRVRGVPADVAATAETMSAVSAADIAQSSAVFMPMAREIPLAPWLC